MTENELIQYALAEDLPSGDSTTCALGLKTTLGVAHLVAKQDLVLSGARLFELTAKTLDPQIQIHWNFHPGNRILKGQIIALISGNLIPLLSAERVGLNFLGRMSGIATLTAQFVDAVQGTRCKILDTRKTTPLFRNLEREAVRDGGGTNHRLNLSEAIMLKENHIVVGGGIVRTVNQVRSMTSKKLIVEVQNLIEVSQCVELKVDRILLDNMTLAEMKQAVELIPSPIETEASGNMSLDRVKDVAMTGVQFISVGALTHSVKCADISLLYQWKE